MTEAYPVIDLAATGSNIRRLRLARGLTVRALQAYFGFDEPRAIYKWQSGSSLPSVDNLYALGRLLGVPIEEILVPVGRSDEQQATACCSVRFASILSRLAAVVTVPVVHCAKNPSRNSFPRGVLVRCGFRKLNRPARL